MLQRITLLFLAFLSLSAFKGKPGVDEWVYEQESKGIKIFTKKSKWGRMRDSKAVMVVATPPDEMLRLLTDFDHYHTWLARCKSARVVARFSENEFIAHMTFDAPWPVKDRDCVLRVKIDRDPKSGTIIVTHTSEPKYIHEENEVVRIEQLVSTWKLIPRNGGTEVINEYASNPGGNIPDWMTTSESVTAPMVTFGNLKSRATVRK